MDDAANKSEQVDATASERTIAHAAKRRTFLQQSFGERAKAFWWGIARTLLFRRTPSFLNGWRIFLLKLFGADIGHHVRIHPSARIYLPWNFTARDHVVIEHGVIVNCIGTVTVGERSRISQYAHLVAGTHDYERRNMQIIRSPITIGKDAWIAADAFVGPGVTIGDGSLLAARSSAFKALPPGMVCIGEPARPVKPRDPQPAQP